MIDVLSTKYGVDDAARIARLRASGLGDADHPWVDVLHRRVVQPHMHDLAMLLRRNLGAVRTQVVRAHASALAFLGRDFDTGGYAEARLRTAVISFRAGVPLSTYITVHFALARGLLSRIPPDVPADVASVVLKLTALDLSLAADAYHHEQVMLHEKQITRAEAAEREQRTLARTDSLTGLVNRLAIEQRVEQSVHESREAGSPFSVIMVDVDRFKDVNDRHGHAVGDAVLRQVSSRMGRALREGDVIGRYGGEEFLVLLHDTDLDMAVEVGERLRARVKDDVIHVESEGIAVTISLGVAALLPGEGSAELVARADAAMYRAKREGRDRTSARRTQSTHLRAV